MGGYGGSTHDHVQHQFCYGLLSADFAYVDLDEDFPSYDARFAGSDQGAENLLDMESVSTYRTCLEVAEGLGSFSQAHGLTSEADLPTWGDPGTLPGRSKFVTGRDFALPAGETGPL